MFIPRPSNVVTGPIKKLEVTYDDYGIVGISYPDCSEEHCKVVLHAALSAMEAGFATDLPNTDRDTAVWNEILEEYCNCYANPMTGNRKCDDGAPCTMCNAEWIQDVYRKRIAGHTTQRTFRNNEGGHDND